VTQDESLPVGLRILWGKERWLSIEDSLLRVERELRLLDRASPLAVVDIRDRALQDPTVLVELEHLHYERLGSSMELRRVLAAVSAEVMQREPSVLRELMAARIAELGYEIGLAEYLGTSELRVRVRASYLELGGRSAGEALALAWGEAPFLVEAAQPRVSLKEVALRRCATWPEVRVVERRLLSRAAAGDGVLFIRQGLFVAEADAERIVAHEVYGHLLMRASARTLGPPFRIGTAESWLDEEGRAVLMEETRGLLSPARKFELALGHRVCERLLAGDGPYDVFRALAGGSGEREALVTSICRGARGGGLCRELGYLVGYERVRRAAEEEAKVVERMGLGRLSVKAVEALWAAQELAARKERPE
jgi:hypothetical protein